MSDSIIIIESPNKKDKIQKISGFETYATIGHFKDLPNHNYINFSSYAPNFEFKSEEVKKRMNFIFSKCKGKEVFIATDPDREGYAIGYMFYQVIKNIAKSIKRAEFYEITEAGIKKGLANALDFTKSNFNEFEAFKARSVGDKLVGFILSPKYINLLSDRNTSIGRVQTPALNFIVSKEKEIKAFNSLDESEKLSYKLKAHCQSEGKDFILESEKICKDKAELEDFLKFLQDTKEVKFEDKITKESKKTPDQPFRTSQLQQSANQVYGFSSDETMLLAQQLFERGLITYTRTDSNALSAEFITEVESFFGKEQWYQKREYKAGKQSQAEAHEAIRITHIHAFDEIEKIIEKANAEMNEGAKKLSADHIKLYTLIYKNSVLSQAKDKITQITNYNFTIKASPFKTSYSKVLYEGYASIFKAKDDENEVEEENPNKNNEENPVSKLDLDFLTQSSHIRLNNLENKEIKRQAPSRYKESSFISLLEKEGIGRPSTYASFLPTLLKRQYIELVKKGKNNEIAPTEKGMKIIELLLANDEWITKSEYTRTMEEVLEAISKNECKYLDFVKPLHQKMNFVNTDISNKEPSEAQIRLLEKLCKEQNKELPQDAFKDFNLCKKAIDELIKTAPKKPPSEKQIKLARDLAEKNKLELPKDYESDISICRAFIDSIFKKNKKE
ncbi:type IA DNA topoisomerase [Campylobacter sp. MIT 97-5078]|uniref:type IA DNA topoisomerase n=1 Tax=Campylobacter sp. MIT 97-5078 TaxID=1548153 RepID=UPI000512B7D6|nr:type IA DNA topoisomerase [Campylobacter sp. MIT 97-5078]KGI55671.1 DNA topoisomerase I [Campylobacter sp. MIT 97-5078]KGI56807.1 DNA topoisomerase I [Campylobacter sp. MIT 97-5078]TQR25584.1 type IA DNA topoisomerase [Campylobacter sp. MIT 97-5078]